MLRFWMLTCILWLWLPSLPTYAQSPATLSNQDFNRHGQVLRDVSGDLSASEVWQKFQYMPPNGTPSMNLPENSGVYWLHYRVSNPQNQLQTYILDLDYILIKHSQLFRLNGQITERLQEVDIKRGLAGHPPQ